MQTISTHKSGKSAGPIDEQQEILDLARYEQLAHDEAALRELSFISELELTCQDCIQGSLRICGEHCTVVV